MRHIIGRQYESTCTEGLVIEIIAVSFHRLTGKIINGGLVYFDEIGTIKNNWAPHCFEIEVKKRAKQFKSLLTPTLK